MRNDRKGFTLIELLIVVVIVGILALAAIPLITSNTRDARRAEGEQLMGSARDFCRVEYSKTGSDAAVSAPFAAQVATGAFNGEYFQVLTYTPGAVQGQVDATSTGSDTPGLMTFVWASGNSNLSWP